TSLSSTLSWTESSAKKVPTSIDTNTATCVLAGNSRSSSSMKRSRLRSTTSRRSPCTSASSAERSAEGSTDAAASSAKAGREAARAASNAMSALFMFAPGSFVDQVAEVHEQLALVERLMPRPDLATAIDQHDQRQVVGAIRLADVLRSVEQHREADAGGAGECVCTLRLLVQVHAEHDEADIAVGTAQPL